MRLLDGKQVGAELNHWAAERELRRERIAEVRLYLEGVH